MKNRRIIEAIGWMLLMLGCIVYNVHSLVTAVDPKPGVLVITWLGILFCGIALAIWSTELHKTIKNTNKNKER